MPLWAVWVGWSDRPVSGRLALSVWVGFGLRSVGFDVSQFLALQKRRSGYLGDEELRKASMSVEATEDAFTRFATEVAPRLNQALICVAGDAGRDAASEALIYGWQHWERVRRMENPAGYLYRVGLSRARRNRIRRERPIFPEPPDGELPWVEPKLPGALAGLSDKQRATVVLVHGFGWTIREVAEFMGVSAGTVQKHDERAMRKLRSSLKVGIDA